MRCEKRLRALLSIIVAHFHENRAIFSTKLPDAGCFAALPALQRPAERACRE
jgi:hypothetical protein